MTPSEAKRLMNKYDCLNSQLIYNADLDKLKDSNRIRNLIISHLSTSVERSYYLPKEKF